MYPPEKSIEQLYGTLDIHANRIENRLAQYRRLKKRIPSILLRGKKEAMAPGELEIWDRSLTREVDGEIETGNWRPATQYEIEERKLLLREQQRIKQLQTGILRQPGVQRRIVQPGTTGGTFSDKITESVKPQQTKRHDPLGLFE